MLEIALFCLSMNIFFEARNQPLEGQRAIAEVTMTRANGEQAKVCNVVAAKKQFSWTNKMSGKKYSERLAEMRAMKPTRKADRNAWEVAVTIAKQTLSGQNKNLVKAADHFYNPKLANPPWKNNMIVVAKIGDHIFLRS